MRNFKEEYGPFGLPNPEEEIPNAHNYYRTLRDYRDYARMPADKHQHAMLRKKVFKGVMNPRREGEESRYVDESIYSVPGHLLIHMRGVAEKERQRLSSEADIHHYLITIGLDEQSVTIQVNTREHYIAQGVADELFEAVQPGFDEKGNQIVFPEDKVHAFVESRSYRESDSPPGNKLIEHRKK